MLRFSRAHAASVHRISPSIKPALPDRWYDVALLAGLLAALFLAGCATTPAKKNVDAAKTEPKPAQPAPAVAESEQKPTGDRLAAVEDFLTRTQRYTLNEPTDTPSSAASPVQAASVHLADAAIAEPPNVQAVKTPPPPPPQVTVNTHMDAAAHEATKPALPALERLAIRTNSTTKGSAPTESRHAPNVGLRATLDHRRGLLDEAIIELKKNAETSETFDAQWRLVLAQLASGDPLDPDEIATKLSAEQRILLRAMIQAATTIKNLSTNNAMPANDALNDLVALENMIAGRADPVISTITFCSKVLTFGVYDEMPVDEFVAGRSVATILYSEIRNFRSEQADGSAYVTRLRTRAEILSATGQSVWSRDEPEIVDSCRNRRRDFFIAQRLTIPPTLAAGDYVLKLYVEDQIAGRATEATRSFSVLSPISVAKTDSR